MKRYVVLLAYEPAEWARADPSSRQSFVEDHRAFEQYVEARGRCRSSAALADVDTATTLGRGVGEARTVSDGPLGELAEPIGGYYDVELPDLDSAISAARRLPRAYTVEVRPVVDVEGHALA